jgi:hypothetical protein
MIQANELRIGNLIQCPFEKDGPKHVVTITGLQHQYYPMISWSRPGCCPMPFCHLADDYEGIPVIEEWLIKFGFVKCHPDEDRWQYELQLPDNNQLEYNERQTKWKWSYNGVCLPRDPEFVHQLQNLYFALTGEELMLK